MSHVYNSDWTWAMTKGRKRRDKSRTFGTTEGNKAIFISYRKGKLTNPGGLLFIGFPATENLNVIMDQDFLTIIDILELVLDKTLVRTLFPTARYHFSYKYCVLKLSSSLILELLPSTS